MRACYHYYLLLGLDLWAGWPYYPPWAGASLGAAWVYVAQVVAKERLAHAGALAAP